LFKWALWSRFTPSTGTNDYGHLVSARGTNRDYRAPFSPGSCHEPGLKPCSNEMPLPRRRCFRNRCGITSIASVIVVTHQDAAAGRPNHTTDHSSSSLSLLYKMHSSYFLKINPCEQESNSVPTTNITGLLPLQYNHVLAKVMLFLFYCIVFWIYLNLNENFARDQNILTSIRKPVISRISYEISTNFFTVQPFHLGR
jgi:hypothetical protein